MSVNKFSNGLQAPPRLRGCTEADISHPNQGSQHPNPALQYSSFPKVQGRTGLHLAEEAGKLGEKMNFSN